MLSAGIVADGRDIAVPLMEMLKETGSVRLPEGVYRSSPLTIPSGASLELEKGAVIEFIPDFSLYKPVFTRWEGVKCWCMHPCLYIDNAENVTISGEGTIDGAGAAWWEETLKKKGIIHQPQTELEKMFAAMNPGYEEQPGGGGGRDFQFLRPPLVQIKNSRNVRIEGITFKNSPFWTIHPLFSENLLIKNVHIANPADAPNTDGIDIESCSSVEVIGCTVEVGDDGIALKSGSGPDGIKDNIPTKNILIKGCTVRAAHGGAVIGSETAAEISDATVEDCFFDGTDRGIRIKSRRSRGGLIHNLVFRRITMKDNLCPFVINTYYRCGTDDMTLFSLEKQPIDEGTPILHDILVENCTATGCRASAGMAVGLPEMPVKQLTIRDCSFSVASENNVSVDESDMYNALPTPASRGFRLRNVNVHLENLAVDCEGEKVITESGTVIE